MGNKVKPLLSIIIVSYNTKRLLLDCVASLYETINDINFEIIVVDNNSTDGSAEALERQFHSIRVLKNTENLGFGHANNLAFQIARGEYYLLLNTDTILSSSPKAMVDFMENTKDAGIVGAKLVFGDGRVQKSCWRYPNFILQWWYFSVDILYGIFPLVSGLKYRGINYNKCSVVDCISGNGMLLRSEILKKIKGFDCSIFMYFEDTDFCHRLNKIKQFKVYYYPEYSIIHYHGKSSPKSKATLWSYQSYLYLLQKNSKPKFVQFFHLLCKCSWSTEILLLSITKKFFNNPTIEKKIDLLKILNDVKVC